jgi:arylsulfatase A-like enzyme
MVKRKKMDNTMVIIFTIAILSLFTWFFLAGHWKFSETNKKHYNVILISPSVLRADHLGTYGYFRNTSPNIDKFADESVVFENAFSQGTWTLPSQASVLTSQYPSVHNVLDRTHKKPFPKPALDVIRSKDYYVAGIVGGLNEVGYVGSDLSSLYGFDTGFDFFDDYTGRYFNMTLPAAIKWLEENRTDRYFLFVHGFDIHSPYHNPEPFEHFFDPYYNGTIADHEKFYLDSDKYINGILYLLKEINGTIVIDYNNSTFIELSNRDMDHIIAHYDEGILYADYYFDKFIEELKKLDLYKNSIIILYSDHGETLGEHIQNGFKIFTHSDPYEVNIHVPLIIKHPDYDPGRISQKAQLIDIMPTILDFLSIKIPPELQGKSLVPVIEKNEDVNEYVYGLGIDNMKYIRSDSWKLIMRNTFGEGRVELYNIEEDSKESHNLLYNYPEIAKKLEEKISEWDIMNYYKRVRVNQK